MASANASAAEKLADATAKASDEIAAAQDRAVGGIARGHAKIQEANAKRDEAISRWQDAEDVVRYGFSVRSQYPASTLWDERLEEKLQTEWQALGTGLPWKVAKAGIHRGWDYASTTH